MGISAEKAREGPAAPAPVKGPWSRRRSGPEDQDSEGVQSQVRALDERQQLQQGELSAIRSVLIEVHMNLPLHSIRASRIALRSTELSKEERELALSSLETKEQQIKAERSLELMALYDRTVAGGDQESTADLTSPGRDQLSSSQPTNQQPLTISSKGLNCNSAPSDCDMSSSSGRVRGTAEIFQQQQQQWTGQEVRSSMSSPPSRRIGSMFRKEPEYWCVDDEFPAPPPRLEADQVSLAAAEDASNPPPPPRQSSRGKVNEYRGWSGGWGGDRHSSAHKHKLH